MMVLIRIAVTDSGGNVSSTLTITSFTVAIPPIIAEETAVTTPTNDTTPNYTFSSSKAGTITYGGSCSSSTTIAVISGNNTITSQYPERTEPIRKLHHYSYGQFCK